MRCRQNGCCNDEEVLHSRNDRYGETVFVEDSSIGPSVDAVRPVTRGVPKSLQRAMELSRIIRTGFAAWFGRPRKVGDQSLRGA
jgi:hypothetical protein